MREAISMHTHLDVRRIAREIGEGTCGHLRRPEAWVHQPLNERRDGARRRD